MNNLAFFRYFFILSVLSRINPIIPVMCYEDLIFDLKNIDKYDKNLIMILRDSKITSN